MSIISNNFIVLPGMVRSGNMQQSKFNINMPAIKYDINKFVLRWVAVGLGASHY